MSDAKIIVHGGAGTIRPRLWAAYRDGAHVAAGIGQQVLNRGGSALDAVIEAVVNMEDNPVFNCGTGSCLTYDGRVECDAFVMTSDLRVGAVSIVTNLRNPVRPARVVMEQTVHHVIAGEATNRLADAHAIEKIDPHALIVDRRRRRWQEMMDRGLEFMVDPELEASDDPADLTDEDAMDTVGACAVDREGRVAVAGSTGGIMLKYPGRVGDTPMPGAGNYAGPAGAVACTGHGEAIMRVCLAKYCYDLLEQGVPVAEAASRSISHLTERVQGFAGLIAIDAHGNRAWATSTPNIPVGIPERVIDDSSGQHPA